MLNSVQVRGFLTRDGELKHVGQNDTPILEFSVANETWFGQAHTSFFNCTSFGKRAESVAPYMKKGTAVAIQGKVKQERWEKDGNNRSKVVIIVDDIDLLPRGVTKDEGKVDSGDSGQSFDDDEINF